MRGYFGIGVYNPKTVENIGTLWRSAFLFGANFIYTIGARYKKQPSDTPHVTKHLPLYNFHTIKEFQDFIPFNAEIVCVEQTEKSRLLPNANHPERAVYLLGAEDAGLPLEILKSNQTIEIPTERKQSMNVAVAGSIVMYARTAKQEDS
jgi:tRNA(Leu) C34 or U34 (ribose-2'-O)-methylase TrmL